MCVRQGPLIRISKGGTAYKIREITLYRKFRCFKNILHIGNCVNINEFIDFIVDDRTDVLLR